MATVFQPNLFQHSPTAKLFQIDETTPLTPEELAQLYGGHALQRKGREKKKLEEPSLEVMVRAVSAEPDGKEAVIAALPKRVRADYPDPQLALVSSLVHEVEAATRRVQEEIARLYHQRIEDDEEELILLIL